MSKRMFSFITKTWNPLSGECLHRCSYCWVTQLKKIYPNINRKYHGSANIDLKELRKGYKFTSDDTVFVCSCNDLFGGWVSYQHIIDVLTVIGESKATFLLLTKNPKRYIKFFKNTPDYEDVLGSCILGATIETDLDHLNIEPPSNDLQLLPIMRLIAMSKLRAYYPKQKLMLSIEPIMRFSPCFAKHIISVKPDFVAVGYNNNPSVKLDEPSLKDTLQLIADLEAAGIKVYRKTLREAQV